MCLRLFFNGRCSLFIKIRSEKQNPRRIQTELKLNRRKEVLGPFTLRKNWVQTRQEKSTDLTSCLLAWVRTRVFFGFGAVDIYGPKTKKRRVRTSFLILTSACVVISSIARAVPESHLVNVNGGGS